MSTGLRYFLLLHILLVFRVDQQARAEGSRSAVDDESYKSKSRVQQIRFSRLAARYDARPSFSFVSSHILYNWQTANNEIQDTLQQVREEEWEREGEGYNKQQCGWSGQVRGRT